MISAPAVVADVGEFHCAYGYPLKGVSTMLKSIPGLLAIALSIGAFTPLTYAENIFQGNSSSVLVMTNDNTKNEILTYQRSSNEQYVLKAHTATGGPGSDGTTDPLQSQGSLTLSHDHNLLFAINSGSGTISSFHLLGGLPILVDQEPTGRSLPGLRRGT
jgi:6-phosphogluconolactonase